MKHVCARCMLTPMQARHCEVIDPCPRGHEKSKKANEYSLQDAPKRTRLAAWKHIQSTMNERQQKVMQLLMGSGGGLTTFQIAHKLNAEPHWVSGRITELKEAGLVKDSGRRMKNTKSNKFVAIWESTV